MTDRDVLWDEGAHDLLREGVSRRLRPGERLDDVINFLIEVAAIRSRNRERPLDGFEVGLVAAALCWWPLKPRPPEAYRTFAQNIRGDLLFQALDGLQFWEEGIPEFIVRYDPERLMRSISEGQPPSFA